jgi:hypothetical protein
MRVSRPLGGSALVRIVVACLALAALAGSLAGPAWAQRACIVSPGSDLRLTAPPPPDDEPADDPCVVEDAFQRMSEQSCDATREASYDLGAGRSLTVSLPAVVTARGQVRGDASLEAAFPLGASLSLSSSIVLPTGDALQGVGKGATAINVDLPLTVRLGENLEAGLTAGATWSRGTLEPLGTRRDTLGTHATARLVYRPGGDLDIVVEALYVRDPQVEHDGAVWSRNTFLVSPGIRFKWGGVAFPIGVGGHPGVYIYLSR